MGELLDGISRALGYGLAFFYDLVPNFGVAIMLVTIAINILVFPLTLKQTRATRAFQQIQPEVKRIQKEHKDDPQKMQQELMRVQREAGATPGGCLLPLLVQFPIWLGLFRVLNSATPEIIRSGGGLLPPDSALTQAIAADATGFLGMKLNLRVSEAVSAGILTALPYLAMLAVMVASQYIQQWHAQRGQLTPASGINPQQQQTQQAITRIMPLFIGVISYNFPAGLVLYWTTSNIFRLGQQVLIFKMEGRPGVPVADASPPRSEGDGEEKKRPQPGPSRRRRRRRK